MVQSWLKGFLATIPQTQQMTAIRNHSRKHITVCFRVFFFSVAIRLNPSELIFVSNIFDESCLLIYKGLIMWSIAIQLGWISSLVHTSLYFSTSVEKLRKRYTVSFWSLLLSHIKYICRSMWIFKSYLPTNQWNSPGFMYHYLKIKYSYLTVYMYLICKHLCGFFFLFSLFFFGRGWKCPGSQICIGRQICLKVRWPQFQARPPSLSFLIIEGRAAANPPLPSIWHQYVHILRNFSRVGSKISYGEASHHKKLAFAEVFTGNRCF